ncbi:hypothetical protein BD779DRAFT_1504637 [Infundibulicybe gibba]|nr:hypothetical protein BD779DRAFT_1504637 [Infundibulicybe gibba]
MSDTCVASTSRQNMEFSWQPPTEYSPFPTSDVRLECRSQPTTLASTNPHRRLGSVAGDHPAEHRNITCYPTSLPRRVEIQRGVWFDGTDTVLSATFPDVEDFLANARNALSLPTASSEIIFTLAALEVFYNPGDPAHWLFWSDEKKYETAKMVTRIALHRPPLIHSNVTWNGTPEYLFILANRHGSTWRQLYETQIWYPVLVPPKVASPVRVLNLRKRKPAQMAMRDLSLGLGDDDIEDPPPKRARTRGGSGPTKKPVPNDAYDVADANIKDDESPPSECSSVPLDDTQPDNDTPALAPINADIVHESPSTRASTRQRSRKIIRESPTSGISSRSSSSAPSPPPISAPPTPHSRNRSISQASAETLVGHQRRRSFSSLSTETAVEFIASKGTEILDKMSVVTAETDDSTAGEPAVSLMVTRGRTKGAQAVGGSKISHVINLEEKKRPNRSRGANPPARSRGKQPRKALVTKT